MDWTIPITIKMDLANGPTGERFCYAAAEVLGTGVSEDDARYLSGGGEFASEVVQEWTDRLDSSGYAVFWDAGDVIVYDLRGLSDDEREEFYRETENF